MNEELDFEDYPTLYLHMMIDDYEELCREANKCYYSDTAKTEYNIPPGKDTRPPAG